MNDTTFTAVVAQMMHAQQKFFSLPPTHPERGLWLKRAKRLEGIVNREIKRRIATMGKDALRAAYAPYDEANNTKQLSLFK